MCMHCGSQIEVFKVMEWSWKYSSQYISQKITKGHDFTLVKGRVGELLESILFPKITINEWNKLSADRGHSSSVNV